MRPSWDEYFLGIARAVSLRADCRRAQHGCVIVDSEHRIVSTGYNGSPSGDPRSCLKGDCLRGFKTVEQISHSQGGYEDCISLHAEHGAIVYGDGVRMRGGTAYLTGPPCPMCRKLLVAAGLGIVYEGMLNG